MTSLIAGRGYQPPSCPYKDWSHESRSPIELFQMSKHPPATRDASSQMRFNKNLPSYCTSCLITAVFHPRGPREELGCHPRERPPHFFGHECIYTMLGQSNICYLDQGMIHIPKIAQKVFGLQIEMRHRTRVQVCDCICCFKCNFSLNPKTQRALNSSPVLSAPPGPYPFCSVFPQSVS